MVEDKERARLVHVIRALATGLVLTMFLSFRFSSNLIEWTLDATIILFVLFFTALIAVNIWIHYTFEKTSQNQACST